MKIEQLAVAEKIYIAGYGAEGRAAEKFCQAHCSEVSVEIMEDIRGEVTDLGGVYIVSPGIRREWFSHIPRERVTSGTEIFFDSLTEGRRKSVVGISGTKGKSTTTKFTVEVLPAAGKKVVAAGNYGVPLLDVFDDFEAGAFDYVVAELSSYQLESLETSPGIAIFLNIFPDHLDRHGTVEDYFLAKQNLWAHQRSGDYLIVPSGLAIQIGMTNPVGQVVESCALNPEIFPENSAFRAEHWCENLACVAKLLELLDLSRGHISVVAKEFQGLPHRMENFSHAHDIEWWDDAICTNPEAASANVRFFGEKLGALVVGGQARGMDVSPLAKTLAERAPGALVLVLESEASASFLEVIEGAVSVAGFDEAVSLILEKVKPGMNAVLCPAAPSYDRFKNYIEKGGAWQEAVEKSL